MLSDDQLWRKTRKLYQEEKVITGVHLAQQNMFTQ